MPLPRWNSAWRHSLLLAWLAAWPATVLADDSVDDSGLRELIISEDSLKDLVPANQGAFEGGASEAPSDASDNNIIIEGAQRDDGIFNIPTNSAPSPLFGARAFSQPMLRFEEFGTEPLTRQRRGGLKGFPQPRNAQSGPTGQRLEAFLSQPVWPQPTRLANTVDQNPWQRSIEAFLGRPLDDPPAEGRPPGEGWAHQRWDEFPPQVGYHTAQAGARVNGGFRDSRQRHQYRRGEFGPGGLYHQVGPRAPGSAAGVNVQFHPKMPVQAPNSLWTFDGTFPPKLLNVRYGEAVVMRHYNALPIDVAANNGFGLHTLSTHEHNGHTPAESDGYTNAFFFPGQYYDYRWPVILAGYDSINTDASDPRAGRPDDNGGIVNVRGDWRETMSTHWFHDHMLDFTAQNVYKGNAAMMNYYSSLDRGNEALDDGVNLRLPSGSALDWGNRDYDVNLMLAEKAWDQDGQLSFNPFNQTGFIGDVMTVNWLYKPFLKVRARKYRFRILNGSVSRYFKVALVDQEGDAVPFYMVANDGNIMEHTVYFENGELPTLGVAERYDIIVDFSQFKPGDRLYLVNLLSHKNGQATDEVVPMADILSGAHAPRTVDDDGDGKPDRWVDGDPVVGRFLEFRVRNYRGEDLSLDPAEYVAGGKKLIPLNRPTEDELANALHRTFEFERQPTDETPWVIETDGGKGFSMDPRRLSAAPEKNHSGVEVWRIVNSGTWSHPIHIHFEEGQILRRGGKPPPEWEKWARKDVYRLGPQPDSTDMVEIALRFREFAGSYMEHCHNTQHEDHAMLLRWDIENPGQTLVMPTPIPSWDGVSYVDTVALPTFREGDAVGEFGPVLDPVTVWLDKVEVEMLDDIRDMPIGDALDEQPNERGVARYTLDRGINRDADGNEREVFFVLHDISDEALAEEMNIAWAGGLQNTPVAATSEALYEDGRFVFLGDLPNPITRPKSGQEEDGVVVADHPDIPPQSDANTYSSLRRVNIDGKDVVMNAFFVKWGEQPWEQLRVDEKCRFPDFPANTGCIYNGPTWGLTSSHAVEINTDVDEPYLRIKLHKSFTEGGDYLPYYVVVDSFPAGPANNMGVPYVPKHKWLDDGPAVPLVQFAPKTAINDSYPPIPLNGFNVNGGGPMGGQVGIPSYFMPEDDYSPMWHIGFTNWLEPADRVVKGIQELKDLRAEGKIEIYEWPAVRVGNNDYSFENGNAPEQLINIVNCPTPMTIDSAIHRARNSLVN